MEKCIEIQNLQKSFGAIHAVNNLSLQVETGQLFAFLGVNGAGKSTTISMICGQLRQDAGQIYVNGRKAEQLYRKYQEKQTGLKAVCLPSTSPANAAWSVDRLVEAWKVIRE